MCIYVYIYMQEMKFLWSKLFVIYDHSCVQTLMPTIMTKYDQWQTKHDYIGSLACIPYEPKIVAFILLSKRWHLFVRLHYPLVSKNCALQEHNGKERNVYHNFCITDNNFTLLICPNIITKQCSNISIKITRKCYPNYGITVCNDIFQYATFCNCQSEKIQLV